MNLNIQAKSQPTITHNNFLYPLLVIGIFTAIGFIGYYFGFLGFIYQVMIPEIFGNFSLVILSIIFGVAAFFSPCTFTVLPAYISYHLTHEIPETQRISRGVKFGVLAALGVIVINGILGLIIALVGSTAPFAKDPREDIPLILAVRIIAGIVIAILGVLTIKEKTFHFPFVDKIVSKLTLKKGMFLYGILYNGAAIGCSGPLLLGLMVYALTLGSPIRAFGAFFIFSVTMGILMILLTTLVTVFKGRIAQKLFPLTPLIKKTAGVVMIIMGISITLLTLEGNKLFVKIFFPFLQNNTSSCVKDYETNSSSNQDCSKR